MEFKNDDARNTYEQLDERLKDAAYEIAVWCRERKLPFVITRCVSEMIPNVSRTNIHADKRAFDSSVVGWTTDDIDDCLKEFNDKYSETIGAFSITDGKPRLIVAHVGTANHLHIQVRRA